MSFDPHPIVRPDVSRNGVEVAKLRVLERALRAEMPPDFDWDFAVAYVSSHCGSRGCALGLAQEIGLVFDAVDALIEGGFGMKKGEFEAVFGSHNSHRYSAPYESVTPHMVADALAAIITREEAAP